MSNTSTKIQEFENIVGSSSLDFNSINNIVNQYIKLRKEYAIQNLNCKNSNEELFNQTLKGIDACNQQIKLLLFIP